MLAVDYKHDPKLLSVNGASAALVLSNIPWNGPIGVHTAGLQDIFLFLFFNFFLFIIIPFPFIPSLLSVLPPLILPLLPTMQLP